MSRHGLSAPYVSGAAPKTRAAANARYQPCRWPRRRSLMQGFVPIRCKLPSLSRMCARMTDHSTASTASAAPAPAPAIATAAELIDIGINLAHDSYDADRDAVIARARAVGVAQMIVTGSTLASTAQAIELARQHPGRLFATAGVHPHHARELSAQRVSELEELARQPRVVAVGECGLDYYRNF